MPAKKIRAHIVSQTHWDREWYLPFEGFRHHLIRLMDRVLHLFATQPGYRHFVTDGQTIILEDYLEIRPEQEELLRRHVRGGRLVIGPWYILPDEYIVSAESLVRNLLIGRRVAARFGPVSKAGYVPDPFGHVAQMPQILNGFAMDNFIFLRGMPPAEKYGTEFNWRGPDGTSVLAIWMKNIYFNASLLGYETGWGDTEKMRGKFKMERAMSSLEGQLKDLGKWTRCGVILLNNGCDHTPPQFELPDVIATANRHFKNAEFVHSTYDKFIDDVKSRRARLATLDGELRSSRYIVILPGVLSTRMYLKQWNRRCEHLLERWAEPLSAIARHLGGPEHAPGLLHAWKLLLQNHPHDSICGCSTDAVHREMVTRFERVEQSASAVIAQNIEFLHQRIDTRRDGAQHAVIAWNPLPGPRRGALRATLTLPADAPRPFTLVDGSGSPVSIQIGSATHRTETRYLAFNRKLVDVDCTLDAPASGLGYRTLWIAPSTAKPRDQWSAKATTSAIDTDHYRVRFNRNGSLDVFDKAARIWHRRQHLFEDGEDVGDEYDYSPARKGRLYTTEKAKARVRIVARGPLYVEFQVTIPWKVPASATPDRKSRARRLVGQTLRSNIRVYRRHRRIEVTTRFENCASDHRVRLLCDGPARATRSLADGHFATIERAFKHKSTPKHDTPEPTTFHMRHFVALSDARGGIAVLNRALLEYEVLERPRGRKTLAITMLRSVGWLSKDDLISRPTFAGPMIQTPEAQCPGPCEAHYALLPFSGPDGVSDVVAEAESFAAPVLLFAEDCHAGPDPAHRTFIALDRDDLVWSAWKPAEDGNGSVMRLYNPVGNSRRGKITLDGALRIAGECDMKEDPTRRVGKAPHQRSMRAFEIRSWRLQDAASGRRRK